jgi:hypothetical protein
MTTAAHHIRPYGRSRVDQATIALLRTAMSDGWRPDQAAEELLLRTRGDSRLLRLVRAKLSRSMLDRPTRIHQRATLIVDKALTRAIAREEHGPRNDRPAIPQQGRPHD